MSEVLDRQIKCVERELSMRKRVYPGWIEQGRISQKVADEEIEAMHGVLRTLTFMKKWEGVIRSAVDLAKKELAPFNGLDVDLPKVSFQKEMKL